MSFQPSHRTLALIALVTGLGVIAFGARTALQAQLTNVFTSAAQAEEGFTIQANRNTIFFCLIKPTGGLTFPLLDPSLQNRNGLSLTIEEYTATAATDAAKRFAVGRSDNTLTVFERGKLYMVRANQEVFFRCNEGLSLPKTMVQPIAEPSENPAGQEEGSGEGQQETEEDTPVQPIENPLTVTLENPMGDLQRGKVMFVRFVLRNTGDHPLDEVGFSLTMPDGYAIPVGGTSGNCSGMGNEVSCQNFVMAPNEALNFSFPFVILQSAQCNTLQQTRVTARGHLQNMNDLPNVDSNFAGWTVQCATASSAGQASSAASQMIASSVMSFESLCQINPAACASSQSSRASVASSKASSTSSKASSKASSSLAFPLTLSLSGPNGLQKNMSATYTLVLKNTTTTTSFQDLSFTFPFPTGISTEAQSTMPNCTANASGMSCVNLVLQPQLSLTLTLPVKTLATLPCSVIPLKASATAGSLRADSNTINVQGCTGSTTDASVAMTASIATTKTYLDKNVEQTMQVQVAALGTAFSGGVLRVEMPEGFILLEPRNELNVGTCDTEGTVFECSGIDRGTNKGAIYKLPFIITDSATCGQSAYKITFTYLENGLEKTITRNPSMQLCHAAPVQTGPLDRFSITTGNAQCVSADCRTVSLPVTLKNTGPTPATNTIVMVNLDASWKNVTINGASCMIVNMLSGRMFDCPATNYLTIPANSELSYTVVMETDALCPIASPRTAVLVQAAPASVYEQDYSNNSVYATLPLPCQNNGTGGTASPWDTGISDVTFSNNNDTATVRLSEDPGVPSSLKVNIYKNEGIVGYIDAEEEVGNTIVITGLQNKFEIHGGAGQYRLDFFSCPASTEEPGGLSSCGPVFSTAVTYAGQMKPLSATVSRVNATSATLTASRAPEANEYFFASCSPYTGLEDSAGYTKNRSMDVLNLKPDTIYNCRIYIVPSAAGGDTQGSSPEVELRTPRLVTASVDAVTTLSGPETVAPGAVLTLAVTLENKGTTASFVNTLDQVAQGIDYLSADSDSRCKLSTAFNPPRLRCDFGRMDANDAQTATLRFLVPQSAVCNTNIVQRMTAFTTDADKNGSNNLAQATTRVACATSASSAASTPASGEITQTCTGGGMYSGKDCSDNIVSLENFSFQTEPGVNGTVVGRAIVTLSGMNDESTQMVFIRFNSATSYSPERGQPNAGTTYLATDLQYNKTYTPELYVTQRVNTKTSVTNNIVYRKILDPVTIDPPPHVFSTKDSYGLFVTNVSMGGNLNTGDPRVPKNLAWTARADLLCNLAAQDAGLSAPNTNVWKSLLSNPRAAKFPLYNMKNELLAATEDDLWNLQRRELPAKITTALGFEAYGYAWTGRDPTGKVTTNTCNGWSSNYTQHTGAIGLINGRGGEWFQSGNQTCGNFASLYCVNPELQ